MFGDVFMKLKTILGFALIILSIAGMIFWESYGREAIVSIDILTASRDIAAGETVSDGDIRVSSVDKSFVMPSALAPESLDSLAGMRLVSPVKEGQQLAMDMFTDSPVLINDGESFFVIPGSWIFTISCFSETEDLCDVYLMPEKKLLGSYVLASKGEDIEIVCTPGEYFRMFDLLKSEESSSLMIVPSEPEWRVLE